MGDPRGIGPEIILKALSVSLKSNDGWEYIVYGDPILLEKLNKGLLINCPLNRIVLENASGRPGTSPALSAISWIEAAAAACISGKVAGMVTGLIS